MAVYSLDIEKRVGSEFWSNRYIVNAAGLATGQTLAANIVFRERQFHNEIVQFTRYRLSNLGAGNEEYLIVPIGTAGVRATGTSVLPLFNTLRMDFTAATGRPSRKYYRGVLTEGDISGDSITTDFTAFADDIATQFYEGELTEGIMDPQAQLLTDAVVHPFVQMRQLRRSRRRRTNGGGIFQ